MKWSRRRILEVAGGLALLAGGLRASGTQAVMRPARSPLDIPDDLPNPPMRESVDGVLRTELRIAYGEVTLPRGLARLRLYDKNLPGATWRLRPGDRLEVGLVNDLPPNPETEAAPEGLPPGALCLAAGHNRPNCFNTSNLHFHGLHVDPKGASDNVFLEIEPGEAFDYTVEVPGDHAPGTFWYHPHRHGSVAIQIASGMAGMIVMEDPAGPAAPIEREMVIQSPVTGPDGVLEDPALFMSLEDERDLLVNGVHRPRIHLRAGETQHWRMLLASGSQFLPLDFAAIPGLDVRLIGRDGNPLPTPESVEAVSLAPGSRLDLLVTGRRPGSYAFGRGAFHQGLLRIPAAALGEIVVLPAEAAPATARPYQAPSAAFRTPVRDDEIVRRRVLELGQARGSAQPLDVRFTINGVAHEPDRFDIVARVGEAEEWRFVNLTPFPHPMHIHTNPFQVLEVNGAPVPGAPWMDTVIVPAAGVVKIRTRFEDFHGDFVTHCHILPHEDAGMMMNVRILP